MDFKAAGQLLRQARKAKHWTQRELALRTGIDYTYVSKIEHGTVEYAPKPDILAALNQQLELSANNYCRLKQYYNREAQVEWCPSTVLLPDYAG